MNRINLQLIGKVFIVCVIAFYSAHWVFQKARLMPPHCDEVYYYYWTEFFDAVFLNRVNDVNLWNSIDAFDHPNLSKYIYGGYLYTHDQLYFIRRDDLRNTYDTNCIVINNKEFLQSIQLMRNITSVATIITIMSFVLMIWIFTHNIIFSSISGVLLLRNELFYSTMLRATSDGIFIFLITLSFTLYLFYLKYKKKYLFILFSITVGLSTTAKLTGIIWYPILTLFLLIEFILQPSMWKRLINNFIIFTFIILFVWLIHSPNLVQSPWINTSKYVLTREKMMTSQASKDKPDRLKTLSSRFIVTYCMFFQNTCLEKKQSIFLFNSQLTNWTSVNIFVFLCGILFIFSSVLDKNIIYAIAGVYYAFTIIFITMVNPLAWDRYYLPVLICIHSVQIIGIWHAIKKIKTSSKACYIKGKDLFITQQR